MASVIMVGMGEIHLVKSEGDMLVALGLGSCIGVCMYDPHVRVAGMAHVVLPCSVGAHDNVPGKYADTAVPALLEQMTKAGALSRRIRCALAGGAQLFNFAGGAPKLDVGRRNGDAVLEALSKVGLKPLATDLGGNAGRTVNLSASTGVVHVKVVGRAERDLVTLGGSTIVMPIAA